jgi:hypothetical protein
MNEKRSLDTYFWGGVLVLAGLLFGGESLGILPNIGNASAWSWLFLGAGLLSLVLNLVSLSSDSFSDPSTWDWIWGIVFILIGVGGFTTVDISWPLILLLVGVVMLAKALLRRE